MPTFADINVTTTFAELVSGGALSLDALVLVLEQTGSYPNLYIPLAGRGDEVVKATILQQLGRSSQSALIINRLGNCSIAKAGSTEAQNAILISDYIEHQGSYDSKEADDSDSAETAIAASTPASPTTDLSFLSVTFKNELVAKKETDAHGSLDTSTANYRCILTLKNGDRVILPIADEDETMLAAYVGYVVDNDISEPVRFEFKRADETPPTLLILANYVARQSAHSIERHESFELRLSEVISTNKELAGKDDLVIEVNLDNGDQVWFPVSERQNRSVAHILDDYHKRYNCFDKVVSFNIIEKQFLKPATTPIAQYAYDYIRQSINVYPSVVPNPIPVVKSKRGPTLLNGSTRDGYIVSASDVRLVWGDPLNNSKAVQYYSYAHRTYTIIQQGLKTNEWVGKDLIPITHQSVFEDLCHRFASLRGTYIFDYDGVLHIKRGKHAKFRTIASFAKTPEAKAELAAAKNIQAAYEKRYAQHLPVKTLIAELQAAKGDEFKIARILKMLHIGGDKFFVDDRADILLAIYEFYMGLTPEQRNTHFVNGELYLFQTNPQTGALYPFKVQENPNAEERKNHPYVQVPNTADEKLLDADMVVQKYGINYEQGHATEDQNDFFHALMAMEMSVAIGEKFELHLQKKPPQQPVQERVEERKSELATEVAVGGVELGVVTDQAPLVDQHAIIKGEQTPENALSFQQRELVRVVLTYFDKMVEHHQFNGGATVRVSGHVGPFLHQLHEAVQMSDLILNQNHQVTAAEINNRQRTSWQLLWVAISAVSLIQLDDSLANFDGKIPVPSIQKTMQMFLDCFPTWKAAGVYGGHAVTIPDQLTIESLQAGNQLFKINDVTMRDLQINRLDENVTIPLTMIGAILENPDFYYAKTSVNVPYQDHKDDAHYMTKSSFPTLVITAGLDEQQADTIAKVASQQLVEKQDKSKPTFPWLFPQKALHRLPEERTLMAGGVVSARLSEHWIDPRTKVPPKHKDCCSNNNNAKNTHIRQEKLGQATTFTDNPLIVDTVRDGFGSFSVPAITAKTLMIMQCRRIHMDYLKQGDVALFRKFFVLLAKRLSTSKNQVNAVEAEDYFRYFLEATYKNQYGLLLSVSDTFKLSIYMRLEFIFLNEMQINPAKLKNGRSLAGERQDASKTIKDCFDALQATVDDNVFKIEQLLDPLRNCDDAAEEVGGEDLFNLEMNRSGITAFKDKFIQHPLLQRMLAQYTFHVDGIVHTTVPMRAALLYKLMEAAQHAYLSKNQSYVDADIQQMYEDTFILLLLTYVRTGFYSCDYSAFHNDEARADDLAYRKTLKKVTPFIYLILSIKSLDLISRFPYFLKAVNDYSELLKIKIHEDNKDTSIMLKTLQEELIDTFQGLPVILKDDYNEKALAVELQTFIDSLDGQLALVEDRDVEDDADEDASFVPEKIYALSARAPYSKTLLQSLKGWDLFYAFGLLRRAYRLGPDRHFTLKVMAAVMGPTWLTQLAPSIAGPIVASLTNTTEDVSGSMSLPEFAALGALLTKDAVWAGLLHKIATKKMPALTAHTDHYSIDAIERNQKILSTAFIACWVATFGASFAMIQNDPDSELGGVMELLFFAALCTMAIDSGLFLVKYLSLVMAFPFQAVMTLLSELVHIMKQACAKGIFNLKYKLLQNKIETLQVQIKLINQQGNQFDFRKIKGINQLQLLSAKDVISTLMERIDGLTEQQQALVAAFEETTIKRMRQRIAARYPVQYVTHGVIQAIAEAATMLGIAILLASLLVNAFGAWMSIPGLEDNKILTAIVYFTVAVTNIWAELSPAFFALVRLRYQHHLSPGAWVGAVTGIAFSGPVAVTEIGYFITQELPTILDDAANATTAMVTTADATTMPAADENIWDTLVEYKVLIIVIASLAVMADIIGVKAAAMVLEFVNHLWKMFDEPTIPMRCLPQSDNPDATQLSSLGASAHNTARVNGGQPKATTAGEMDEPKDQPSRSSDSDIEADDNTGHANDTGLKHVVVQL